MCVDRTDRVAALLCGLGAAEACAREKAVCQLAQMGSEQVETALLATVGQPDTPPPVQGNCCRLLRLFQLVRALGHVRGSTRERALTELAGLGTPARIVLNQAVRCSPDPVVRTNARRALLSMGDGV